LKVVCFLFVSLTSIRLTEISNELTLGKTHNIVKSNVNTLPKNIEIVKVLVAKNIKQSENLHIIVHLKKVKTLF